MSSLVAPASKDRPQPAEDTHVARVFQVVDLGTQHDTYEGKPRVNRRVRIGFELPNACEVFDESKGPEPHIIGKEYTLSSHPKAALTKVVPSILGKAPENGKAFDVFDLVGAACLVTVSHYAKQDGSTGSKITNISKLMAGMEVPAPYYAEVKYATSEGSGGAFADLPQWLQDKITPTEEFANAS